MLNKLRKWNWSAFVFILCVAELGALSNKTIESTSSALLFGLIMGVTFGIPIAWMSKDN